ncbi:TraR/DksA family transcriptional regulator [Ancylobacter aquaticus]|nr:TraR/DksA family transcriptional regulator [Ancylobacter aquaticus]
MDELDRAQELEERARAVALAAHRERLRGSGRKYCSACGDPIGADRLEAVPNAVRCIGCQTARERWDRRRGF